MGANQTPATVDAVGIQFYPGRNEPVVPDVKLTRARDGSSGVAYFKFDLPSFFDPSYGEPPQEAITAMRMVDKEGEISTAQVSANFVNGNPVAIDATYIMQVSAPRPLVQRLSLICPIIRIFHIVQSSHQESGTVSCVSWSATQRPTSLGSQAVAGETGTEAETEPHEAKLSKRGIVYWR